MFAPLEALEQIPEQEGEMCKSVYLFEEYIVITHPASYYIR